MVSRVQDLRRLRALEDAGNRVWTSPRNRKKEQGAEQAAPAHGIGYVPDSSRLLGAKPLRPLRIPHFAVAKVEEVQSQAMFDSRGS